MGVALAQNTQSTQCVPTPFAATIILQLRANAIFQQRASLLLLQTAMTAMNVQLTPAAPQQDAFTQMLQTKLHVVAEQEFVQAERVLSHHNKIVIKKTVLSLPNVRFFVCY
jgi:hypothetical protein